MAEFVDIIYPKALGLQNVKVLSTCQDDLRKLIDKSSNPAKLRSDYLSRLKILNQYRGNAQNVNSQWFEHLKHVGQIYSIRFKGSDNLRILYTVKDDNAYLLCAFKELKEDSYPHNIEIAQNRVKEFLGGLPQ